MSQIQPVKSPYTPKTPSGRITGVGQGRPKKAERSVDDVTNLIAESSSSLNMSALAQVVLTEFGGPVAFAQALYRSYDAATTSTAKSMILKSVMAIINLGAPKRAVGDLANLSDEDLERTIMHILDKMKARGSDGTQENAAAGELP